LERADAECTRLIAKVETRSVEISSKSLPDLYGRPTGIILEAAKTEAADMIVIGARGRTGAAGVLLGRITEALIRRSPIPLLAVRKKGECVGILHALLTVTGQDV
jgi:nucleotide-binding universal stress UspA family protein